MGPNQWARSVGGFESSTSAAFQGLGDGTRPLRSATNKVHEYNTLIYKGGKL